MKKQLHTLEMNNDRPLAILFIDTCGMIFRISWWRVKKTGFSEAGWKPRYYMLTCFMVTCLLAKILFINIYLHLGFLSFLSVWTLPVLIWYGLHCWYKEGNCAVYGLIPGWSGRKVFWLLSKIQTFYTCDSQILPDLYSGIQNHIQRKACWSANIIKQVNSGYFCFSVVCFPR